MRHKTLVVSLLLSGDRRYTIWFVVIVVFIAAVVIAISLLYDAICLCLITDMHRRDYYCVRCRWRWLVWWHSSSESMDFCQIG